MRFSSLGIIIPRGKIMTIIKYGVTQAILKDAKNVREMKRYQRETLAEGWPYKDTITYAFQEVAIELAVMRIQIWLGLLGSKLDIYDYI